MGELLAPRRLVAGTGADGRSRLLDRPPPELVYRHSSAAGAAASGDGWVFQLWATPAPVPAEAGRAEVLPSGFEMQSPPGATRWLFIGMAPGRVIAPHETTTVDYHYVIDGEVTIVLDEEEATLRAGDLLVVAGARHGWSAGPDGCTRVCTIVGTA